MRSDTNLIKIFGIIGALCVLFSTFMNVATMRFYVGVTNEIQIADTVEEADDQDDVEVYMRYGLTMWEIRTMVLNYEDELSWSREERMANLESIDNIDVGIINEIFGMYGIEFRKNSLNNVMDFVKYVLSTSGLFLILPFAIVAISLLMLAGSILSNKVLKVAAVVLMAVGLMLIVLPSKTFFGIIGIGPVIMIAGIVSSIVSAIGSFVSPGIMYVEE